MTSPTLLVLAAGMGSRYGGLKQLDPVGPSGETILDYSVFDAREAGFGKVVFVIRRDFEAEFRERVGRRYEGCMDVAYVFQRLERLPDGWAPPEGRQKPWGTGHAIWCAREAVPTPFAAINADDFYGRSAYRTLAGFFSSRPAKTKAPVTFAMVGYELGRTLSEHGAVSRGVCAVDAGDRLQGIEECTGIERAAEGARQRQADGTWRFFQGSETVSMNFWGFTPEVFGLLEAGLGRFLEAAGTSEKAEYYIPTAVMEMIARAEAAVQVLRCDGSWFGVTYREDKPVVVDAIRRLIEAGEYPRDLWR